MELRNNGEYQWRREGEIHLFNPRTVQKLQHATREKRFDIFKEYTKLVDDQTKGLVTLRGLMELVPSATPLLTRRSGERRVDHQAIQHRRDVLRLDLRRGAHRHSPSR